jgi:hypothetical protein
MADGGGSNGSRVRLWKVELQKLAEELGFPIQVCHLPPATSKWNKIEHRLFPFISMNWSGKPLVSHEVIVNLIKATTTAQGLRVEAEIDHTIYPAGQKVGMPEPVDPPESQKEAATDRPSSPRKDANEESQKKTMWVFGYGSLMWDNWETAHGCLRHVVAVLPGLRRTFNKASVDHWGTKDKPCPTLNLAAEPSASCKGVAFEFPEEKRGEVLDYLTQREASGRKDLDERTRQVTGNSSIRFDFVVPFREFFSALHAVPWQGNGEEKIPLLKLLNRVLGRDGRDAYYAAIQLAGGITQHYLRIYGKQDDTLYRQSPISDVGFAAKPQSQAFDLGDRPVTPTRSANEFETRL